MASKRLKKTAESAESSESAEDTEINQLTSNMELMKMHEFYNTKIEYDDIPYSTIKITMKTRENTIIEINLCIDGLYIYHLCNCIESIKNNTNSDHTNGDFGLFVENNMLKYSTKYLYWGQLPTNLYYF